MPADTHMQSRRRSALFPRPFLLSAIVALVTTLLFADLVPRFAPGLLRFEHAMGDARTAHFADRLPSQHPHVAVVGISDETLKDNKVRLPIDRLLLAQLIDAIDAAGAKAVGIDVLFTRTVTPDNEDKLIESLRRARAKIVLAAADERLGLTPAQLEKQKQFFAASGRPGGYVNLAIERDWVVRFKAQPGPNTAFPKSFPRILAESAGYTPDETHRRIAWLRDPKDGSEAFQTVPAETLLAPADDAGAKLVRAGLKDKVVIIGGMFPDLDQHLTPLSSRTDEKTPGAVIHAHILAEMIDGRSSVQEANWIAMRLELAAITALAFLIGWRYRLKNKGLLMGSLATIVIVAVDTFVFWQFRIILPVVLALLAWFLGEFSGRYIGRWLGHRAAERQRWFAK